MEQISTKMMALIFFSQKRCHLFIITTYELNHILTRHFRTLLFNIYSYTMLCSYWLKNLSS